MSATLADVVDRFAELDVLVIGEAMLDSYLEGSTDRVCREAPVPIVDVAERKDAPGGAANTAVNVRALGGRPILLSTIGDDTEGTLLRKALAERGASTEHVLGVRERRTLAKHRLIGAGQLLVRFDQGSVEPVARRVEDALIGQLTALFSRADAVIISDYGYGIVTRRMHQTLAELQARTPRVMVADAKQLAAYRDVGLTAVKPNYAEAVQLLGGAVSEATGRADVIARHRDQILDITGAQIAAVTLDTDGAVILQRRGPTHRTYAVPTAHAQAIGAGDTFLAALALALAAGAGTSAAADIASAAANVVVAKPGTATCSGQELVAALPMAAACR